MSDKDGYVRGARGFGRLAKEDRDFLKPDFDVKRQAGPKAVGQDPQVTKGRT
jgi:hypothetical protein